MGQSKSDLRVVLGEHALSPTAQAVQEARAQAFEEAAAKLESIRQTKIPECFQRCDFNFGFGAKEYPDGWRDLSHDEKGLLKSCARLIRELGQTR